jgi:hypothetical protein
MIKKRKAQWMHEELSALEADQVPRRAETIHLLETNQRSYP